jgi:hypothetical protein
MENKMTDSSIDVAWGARGLFGLGEGEKAGGQGRGGRGRKEGTPSHPPLTLPLLSRLGPRVILPTGG